MNHFSAIAIYLWRPQNVQALSKIASCGCTSRCIENPAAFSMPCQKIPAGLKKIFEKPIRCSGVLDRHAKNSSSLTCSTGAGSHWVFGAAGCQVLVRRYGCLFPNLVSRCLSLKILFGALLCNKSDHACSNCGL